MPLYYKHILLALLLFSFTDLAGQNRWVNVYHDDWNAPMLFTTLSYDQGYLISGRQEPNFAKYNWVTKTNINGEVLWEKMIGNGTNSIYLLEMTMNEDGCLFLCGGTKTEDVKGDPIVMKLNACGEKEWCKIFYSEDHLDYARCISPASFGSVVITLSYTGDDYVQDRICLAKISIDGNLEWKECYNSLDSLIGNEDHNHLLKTSDNGFLISGRCYYPDSQGMYAWLKPYFIKTDSLGNLEWELVAFSHVDERGGQAWQTIMSPDGTFFYSAISYLNYDNGLDAPAVLKIDLQGNIVDVITLAPFNILGKAFNVVFINDSTLAVSAVWGEPDINSPMAVISDTMGTILYQYELLQNSYMSYVRYTQDEKLLFYTMMQDPLDDMFDAYLFKLNQDLSHAPVNTQPFTYDSLCPYQIVSDTISQDDCGLIVGLEELLPTIKPKKNEIVVFPNPAISVISYRLSVVSEEIATRSGCVVEVWDLFGRKVEALVVPQGQTELKSDVLGWPAGVYIAIWRNDNEIFARRKFVVAKP
jgi:hypothetical protein